MLPLAEGLPMVLMEHLDNSESIRMLKGTKVKVHSIHLHPDDERESRGCNEYVLKHLPECVYVIKADATWTVGESKIKGLYPIKPVSATWFLDRGRPRPKLGIYRRQCPLSPGFAVTIFSLQGGEVDDLDVDVNISSMCSPQTCYVALSRTKTREGLGLMRSFPIYAATNKGLYVGVWQM